MIIEKISIKSFGMLTDLTLEFSHSINIIEGRNEAGKSTLAAFIKYMLYGFDNSDTLSAVSDRSKRLNWDTKSASGSMVVIVGGRRYLITRSTTTVENVGSIPSYKEEASITDLETGSPVYGKTPAGDVFLSVEQDLYANTAFIGQVGAPSLREDKIKEAIENILFSAAEDSNISRAKAQVDVRMHSLMRENRMGGVIYDLRRRAEEFDENFKKAEADNKEILIKEAKLHEIRTAISEQTKRGERFRDLDIGFRNMLIIKDFDKLHDLIRELDARKEDYDKFIAESTRSGFVPSAQYLTDIAVARRSIDDLYAAAREAEARYEAEQNAVGITNEIEGAIELSDELGGESEIKQTARALRNGKIKNIAGAVASSLAIIFAAVFEIAAKGALAAIAFRIGFALVGLLGIAGAVTSLVFLSKNNKRLSELCAKFSTVSYQDLIAKLDVIGENRARRDGMIRSTEVARVAFEDAKTRYAEAKLQMQSLIERWGGELPRSNLKAYLDELEARVAAFLEEERRLAERCAEIQSEVNALRSTLEGYEEIEVRAQVLPLKRKMLETMTQEEIQRGIEECRENVKTYRRLAEQIEAELFALKSYATDPGALYSKMQENDSRLDELTHQHKAYYLASVAIKDASKKLRAEISPRLGEYTASLMSIMTDKKYEYFGVTDELEVSFKSSDGDERSVDFLSGGTLDLTYIAVRMALIDMLYKKEKPPICFDESFAHQDNVRARSMMKAVKHLADEGYQSFIFTCRAREAALASELSDKTEVFRLSRSDEAVD